MALELGRKEQIQLEILSETRPGLLLMSEPERRVARLISQLLFRRAPLPPPLLLAPLYFPPRSLTVGRFAPLERLHLRTVYLPQQLPFDTLKLL